MKHRPPLVGALALAILTSISAGTTYATPNSQRAAATNIPTSPPPAVEEWRYPGADQIYADTGIRLIKGDGHIIMVNCDTDATVIEVESITHPTSCYEVLGGSGWLTLEVPRVFVIQGDEHNVAATLTTDGHTEAVDIAPGERTPVGEGQSGDPTTLVELHAS